MTQFNPASDAKPPSASPPESKVTPIGDGIKWIVDAFSLFTASPLMWIVFIIVFFVVNLALAIVPFLGTAIFSLIAPMIMAGVVVGCRAIRNGEGLEIDHFVAGFAVKTIPLLILGAIYLAATIVILVVVFAITAATIGTTILMNLGSGWEGAGLGVLLSAALVLLAVLALSLPLMMAYWFAVPLVQFDDVPPLEALKLSFIACLKNFLPFLLYGIVMLGTLIVAVIPFGLGLLVWMPLAFITIYTSYEDVFGRP